MITMEGYNLKRFTQSILPVLLLSSCGLKDSISSTKIIYGEDNRTKIEEVVDADIQSFRHSIGALVSVSQITENTAGIFLSDYELAERKSYSQGIEDSYGKPLCEVPFKEEKLTAYCSGFLVAPNTFITAGHCFNEYDLDSTKIVFNFDQELSASQLIPIEQVYTPIEILGRTWDENLDFAVLRLDRTVSGAEKYFDPFINEADLDYSQVNELVMMGHPAGLPLVVTDGAQIKYVEEFGLQTNLDAFGGNSGSVVFDKESGDALGILVSQNSMLSSYQYDIEKDCMEMTILREDEDRILQRVVRLDKVLESLPQAVTTNILNKYSYPDQPLNPLLQPGLKIQVETVYYLDESDIIYQDGYVDPIFSTYSNEGSWQLIDGVYTYVKEPVILETLESQIYTLRHRQEQSDGTFYEWETNYILVSVLNGSMQGETIYMYIDII